MSGGAPVTPADPDWRHAVLQFWFEELEPAAWFKKDAAVDEQIRDRFATLPVALRDVPPDQLASSAKGALAAVLALDQFPRNLHRGTPAAFACDPHARAVAQLAIALGFDRLLRKDERLFLYLPFEHAEDAMLQARAITLITRLGIAGWTEYAHAHQTIIDRFGRFPHRNAALGRVSTPDELAFLQTANSSF